MKDLKTVRHELRCKQLALMNDYVLTAATMTPLQFLDALSALNDIEKEIDNNIKAIIAERQTQVDDFTRKRNAAIMAEQSVNFTGQRFGADGSTWVE